MTDERKAQLERQLAAIAAFMIHDRQQLHQDTLDLERRLFPEQPTPNKATLQ